MPSSSEEMGKGAFAGVIHCFTASQDFADKALELGLFVSISGIVTFKNAKDLQDFGEDDPRRPPADRDRRPLPRAGAAPRPPLRARLRRRHRPLPRRSARRGGGGAGRADQRQFPQRFSARLRLMKVTILGSGHFERRAPGRQRLGRSAIRPIRGIAAAGSRSWSATTRPGSSSTPGPTFASSCSTPTSPTSTE